MKRSIQHCRALKRVTTVAEMKWYCEEREKITIDEINYEIGYPVSHLATLLWTEVAFMLDKTPSLYLCPFLNFLLFILYYEICSSSESVTFNRCFPIGLDAWVSLCPFLSPFSFFFTSFLLPYFRPSFFPFYSLLYLWALVLVAGLGTVIILRLALQILPSFLFFICVVNSPIS